MASEQAVDMLQADQAPADHDQHAAQRRHRYFPQQPGQQGDKHGAVRE